MTLADNIISITADHYGISEKDLRGPVRRQELVRARHMAMYLIEEATPMTQKEIAALFDRRHHTAVIHARRVVMRDLIHYPQKEDEINALRRKIRPIAWGKPVSAPHRAYVEARERAARFGVAA